MDGSQGLRPKYFGLFAASENTAMILWATSSLLTLVVTVIGGVALMPPPSQILPLQFLRIFDLDATIPDDFRNVLLFLPVVVSILNTGLSSFQGYLTSFVYTPDGGTVMSAGLAVISFFVQFQVITSTRWSEYLLSCTSVLPLVMAALSTQAVLSTYGSVGKLPASWYLLWSTGAVLLDLGLAAHDLPLLRDSRFWETTDSVSVFASPSVSVLALASRPQLMFVFLAGYIFSSLGGFVVLGFEAEAATHMRGTHKVAMVCTIFTHLYAFVLITLTRLRRARYITQNPPPPHNILYVVNMIANLTYFTWST